MLRFSQEKFCQTAILMSQTVADIWAEISMLHISPIIDSFVNNTKLTLTRQSLNNHIIASIHIILLNQKATIIQLMIIILVCTHMLLSKRRTRNFGQKCIQAWHVSSKSSLRLKSFCLDILRCRLP